MELRLPVSLRSVEPMSPGRVPAPDWDAVISAAARGDGPALAAAVRDALATANYRVARSHLTDALAGSPTAPQVPPRLTTPAPVSLSCALHRAQPQRPQRPSLCHAPCIAHGTFATPAPRMQTLVSAFLSEVAAGEGAADAGPLPDAGASQAAFLLLDLAAGTGGGAGRGGGEWLTQCNRQATWMAVMPLTDYKRACCDACWTLQLPSPAAGMLGGRAVLRCAAPRMGRVAARAAVSFRVIAADLGAAARDMGLLQVRGARAWMLVCGRASHRAATPAMPPPPQESAAGVGRALGWPQTGAGLGTVLEGWAPSLADEAAGAALATALVRVLVGEGAFTPALALAGHFPDVLRQVQGRCGCYEWLATAMAGHVMGYAVP